MNRRFDSKDCRLVFMSAHQSTKLVTWCVTSEIRSLANFWNWATMPFQSDSSECPFWFRNFWETVAAHSLYNSKSCESTWSKAHRFDSSIVAISTLKLSVGLWSKLNYDDVWSLGSLPNTFREHTLFATGIVQWSRMHHELAWWGSQGQDCHFGPQGLQRHWIADWIGQIEIMTVRLGRGLACRWQEKVQNRKALNPKSDCALLT